MKIDNLLNELKRRNVIRAAGLYLVGAWLLTQVASTVLPMFGAVDKLLLKARREKSAATSPSAESKAPDEKSVAVLAFANLSDDKGSEYFSDGISEELLTVLQKIPRLHVAARTSAFSFKGKNVT